MRLFKQAPRRPAISAGELQAAVTEGAQVVDVRTDEEWRAGHLPFAVHIPMERLGARVNELNGRTVFVCRSGNRSAYATEALVDRGMDAVNLEGGMKACARAGLPVVRDDGSAGIVA